MGARRRHGKGAVRWSAPARRRHGESGSQPERAEAVEDRLGERFRTRPRRERAGGARRGAGGRESRAETFDAERALGHHAVRLVEAGRVVGADPGAVAAADALLGVDQHRAGARVAAIGARRAGVRAGGRLAVVAGEREMTRGERRVPRRVERGHLPPAGVDRAAVLDPARHAARLAAGAEVGDEAERGPSGGRAGHRVTPSPPARRCRGRRRRVPCPSRVPSSGRSRRRLP